MSPSLLCVGRWSFLRTQVMCSAFTGPPQHSSIYTLHSGYLLGISPFNGLSCDTMTNARLVHRWLSLRVNFLRWRREGLRTLGSMFFWDVFLWSPSSKWYFFANVFGYQNRWLSLSSSRVTCLERMENETSTFSPWCKLGNVKEIPMSSPLPISQCPLSPNGSAQHVGSSAQFRDLKANVMSSGWWSQIFTLILSRFCFAACFKAFLKLLD